MLLAVMQVRWRWTTFPGPPSSSSSLAVWSYCEWLKAGWNLGMRLVDMRVYRYDYSPFKFHCVYLSLGALSLVRWYV